MRMRCAGHPLAVEAAAVADIARDFPRRHAELSCERDHRCAQGLSPVHVLVGVEVRRVATDEHAETLELPNELLFRIPGYLVNTRPAVVARDPLAKIDVQADSECRACAGVGRRLLCRRPPNHQACTGDDAALVRLDHAAVYP